MAWQEHIKAYFAYQSSYLQTSGNSSRKKCTTECGDIAVQLCHLNSRLDNIKLGCLGMFGLGTLSSQLCNKTELYPLCAYYHVWLLPCMATTMYGYYHVWLLPCMATTMYGYYHVWLLPCMATTMYGYYHVWLLPCMATTMYGYYHVWLLPFMATTMYGYYHVWLLPCVSSHIICICNSL